MELGCCFLLVFLQESGFIFREHVLTMNLFLRNVTKSVLLITFANIILKLLVLLFDIRKVNLC
jgi:hypothetical protein